MNQAIIIGADHHNTLGLVRSLGVKGIKPDVLIVKKGSQQIGTVVSKYINKTIIFSTEKDVVDYLITNRNHTVDGKDVLYAAGDTISACLDNNYDRLKDSFNFFNANGNLSSLMSKEKMCSIAINVGLNVPEHMVYHIGDDLPDSIKYPCITKAISSLAGSKADTTICNNKKDLVSFISTPSLCPTIQIEKFIEKNIEFQFIGISINGGETIVIPGHSHIDRPNGIQNTYYFPYIANDNSFTDTLNKAKSFIKQTGYSGLFSIEFLRGKDGIDYFLEMNFRNDGNAICVTDAGYNLPYIWYLYATEQDYNKYISECIFKPVNYCPEKYYLLQCAYGEVSFGKWLSDMLKANSFTDYWKGDSPNGYWLKFTLRAGVWMWRKLLIKLGLRKAPKESIG